MRAVRLDQVVAVEVVGEGLAWQSWPELPVEFRPGMRWRLVAQTGQIATRIVIPLGRQPTPEQTANAQAAARMALLGQAERVRR